MKNVQLLLRVVVLAAGIFVILNPENRLALGMVLLLQALLSAVFTYTSKPKAPLLDYSLYAVMMGVSVFVMVQQL